jgi:hypothetical protein
LKHETLEILAKDFYENLNFRLPFLGKLLLLTSHLMFIRCSLVRCYIKNTCGEHFENFGNIMENPLGTYGASLGTGLAT